MRFAGRFIHSVESDSRPIWSHRSGVCQFDVLLGPGLSADGRERSTQDVVLCLCGRSCGGSCGRLYVAYCARTTCPICLDAVLQQSGNVMEENNCLHPGFSRSVSSYARTVRQRSKANLFQPDSISGTVPASEL